MSNMDQVKKVFKDLEDREFYFYGCHHNRFKIDDMVIQIHRGDKNITFINDIVQDDHHTNPLCKVKLEYYSGSLTGVVTTFDGWYLVDLKTGYYVLMFGIKSNGVNETWMSIDYSPPRIRPIEIVDENYIPFVEAYPEIVVKHYDWFCH